MAINTTKGKSMTIGVSIKIDVSKIDKELLFKGQKGTYLDATVFLDPSNPDEYGNNGRVSQSVSKEARAAGEKGNILGNVKVFWQGGPNQESQPKPAGQQAPSAPSSFDNFDDSEIPF